MDHLIRVLLVSQDRTLRSDVQEICAGRGEPGVVRAHRDFAERLRAVGAGPSQFNREGQDAGWHLDYARSVDAATDLLETPGGIEAAAFVVLLDCDWEYQENILLFTLTLQAISEQAHILFVGTKPEGEIRSLVHELGDHERVSFLRKPLSAEELSRTMMNLAWRGIVTHNLKQNESKGFSGIGAAELAGALFVENQAEQRRMAVQDTLTGLGNRRLYDATLADIFKSESTRRQQCLLLIDLDKFKVVNDTMGHAAGDELLRQVADRLRDLATADDVIVRLGGDEFALIRQRTDGSQELADSIVQSLCTPFEVEGQIVQIGASIGWASVADQAKDAAELSSRADTALYAVKAAGRGSARRYTRDQDRQRLAREALEQELRHRVKDSAAPILFSPIADALNGNIVAAEGVLDLTGDGMADLSEARLEALLADTTLAVEVAFWTVASVIAHAQRMPTLKTSFNMTPRLFRHDQTPRRLGELLTARKIDPTTLIAEVPSSVVFADPDTTSARIRALRDLGIEVMLDDFGIGPISVDALVRIYANGAKTAPSFVHAAVTTANAAQTLRALTLLASGAGMTATVGGVDTGSQWLAMNSFSCNQLQGRAISALLTREALIRRLTSPMAESLA